MDDPRIIYNKGVARLQIIRKIANEPVGEVAGWRNNQQTCAVSRMNGAVQDMERAGIEMVQILKEGGRERSTTVVTPVTTEPRAEKPPA